MEQTGEYKKCPECAEDIKAEAYVCRYCGINVKKKDKETEGRFVMVRIRAHEKSYTGKIYITEIKNRVSDIVNDNRKFISLVEATEEGKLGEIEIGYIALNKSIVESVSVIEENSEKEEQPFYSYSTNLDGKM